MSIKMEIFIDFSFLRAILNEPKGRNKMQFFDTSTFWGRVKEKLWANGMTVKALSERLGESYKSMTNRITQNRIPKKMGLIKAIADELGCSVEYLMTGTETAGPRHSRDIEDLLDKYKRLDEPRKKAALAMLDGLVVQQEAEDEKFKQKHPELFRT